MRHVPLGAGRQKKYRLKLKNDESVRPMDKNELNRTKSFWGGVLQRDRFAYPSEFVVRFLARARGGGNMTDKRALDVGFGSAHNLGLLLHEGYLTSGTEVLPEAITTARELYGNSPLLGELVLGDLADCSFEPESFDVIVCFGVPYCLKSKEALIEDTTRLARWLRPGGRLMANFRTPFTWFAGMGRLLSEDFYELDARAGEYAGAYYYFPPEDSARHLLEGAGLEIENFERLDWWKNNMSDHHSWWITWSVKK